MIIVAGTITIDPSDFAAYQAASEPMVAATLAEDGCVTYNFAQSVVDPTEIRIFEIWETKEALEAHFVVPHMATFQAALSGLKIGSRNLAIYEADKVADL